jgi:hypothetical protein
LKGLVEEVLKRQILEMWVKEYFRVQTFSLYCFMQSGQYVSTKSLFGNFKHKSFNIFPLSRKIILLKDIDSYTKSFNCVSTCMIHHTVID